jgi:hypothetical protein
MPMIPMELGCTPCGDDSYAEKTLQALLRLQGVGAYPTDDDSARVGELYAWALVLGDAACALDALAYNLHAQHAEELLTEHELQTQIPNDAARTLAERRARLVALRSYAATGNDAETIATVAALGTTITTLRGLAQEQVASGSPREALFQTAIVMDEAAWTSRARREIENVLRRTMPAYAYGQLGHHTPDEMLVTGTAIWGSFEDTLGRTALAATDVGCPGELRPHARSKSYGIGSRLTARDINAIQDHSLIAPCQGGDNQATMDDIAAGRTFFFACEVLNGTSAQIVASMSNPGRYVRAIVVHSSSDIRPGQGFDTVANQGTQADILWSLRASGASSRPLGLAGLTLTTNGFADRIYVTNASGSTRYVVGMLVVTPDVQGGNIDQRVYHANDGEALDVGTTEALWTILANAGPARPGNGPAAQVWGGFDSLGGLVRVGVLPNSTIPGTGGCTTHVLDSEIDWRDRILVVIPCARGQGTGNVVFPGCGDDFRLSTPGGARAMWTGLGITPGLAGAAPSGYEAEVSNSAGTNLFRIAARDTDGVLIIQHIEPNPPNHPDQLTAGFIILASDQLGERSSATPLDPPPAATDGDPIVPWQLNWIQDVSHGAQVAQGVDGVAINALPLGPVKRGHLSTPISWQIRPRRALLGEPTYEQRQPVAGRLRRYFAVEVPDGSEVEIDLGADWRDRFVSVCGTASTNNILPAALNEGDINTTVATVEHFSTCFYTGPGEDGAELTGVGYYLACSSGGVRLYLYARDYDGVLCIKNQTGDTAGTRWVAAMIEASFQLGPRS